MDNQLEKALDEFLGTEDSEKVCLFVLSLNEGFG